MANPSGEITVITETHKGKYQVRARAGDASFLIDEPVSAGGLGAGPNPYDLLGAALGACTTMTLRLYADRKGWPLTDVRTAVRHKRASLNAKDSFELDISLEGALDDAQRARLMEIADRCPVHLTLARGSDVRAALMPPAMAPIQPLDGAGHMDCMREACAD